MPTIEEGLYSYITGHASLSPLIGTRCYPLTLPQNPTYRAVVYNRVSTVTDMAHDGPGDLDRARFQFDCYAAKYSEVKALATALKTALDGYRGDMGGVAVHGVFFKNMLDDFTSGPDVWRVMIDFLIMYKV